MKILTGFLLTSSLTLFITPFFSQASQIGSGVVALEGRIIDSACGLEAVSADQTIEMPSEPISRLMESGEGEPHPFQLRLVNCSLSRPDPTRPGINLPDWQHLQVTFDGPSDRAGRSYATFGKSKGVALDISDSAGQKSMPGEPMRLRPLMDGDITLDYTMRLVGNGRPLAAGTHSSTVRFRLEYF